MSKLERLLKAQAEGFEIDAREIRNAQREERRGNKPEPVKPDPLSGLIKELVAEIKTQAATQSTATDKIISQVVAALRDGFKDMRPESKPKKQQLEVMDSGGKLKYTINVKQVS